MLRCSVIALSTLAHAEPYRRYVHVLGDAYPILTDPCLGLSGEYPWAMTFAGLASLVAFTLEWVLHKSFHRKLKVLHAPNGAFQDAEASTSSVNSGNDILPVTMAEQQTRLRALHNVVISYTFEVGIIFHSESCMTVLLIAISYRHILTVQLARAQHDSPVPVGLQVACHHHHHHYTLSRQAKPVSVHTGVRQLSLCSISRTNSTTCL